MKKIILAVVAVALALTFMLGFAVACDRTQKEVYKIIFTDNGQTVKSVEVKKGAPLTEDQIPCAPQAPQGKVFDGWYVGETKVTVGYTPSSDVSAIAKYVDETPQLGSHIVTFKNGDTVVGTAQVESGKSLTADQIPVAPQDAQGRAFDGWYVGEEKIEVGYTPTNDVTAVAKFNDENDITGSGTKEDPYVIHTAQGFVTFADNVNHPDVEATEHWYNSHVKLGADIDMTGVDYIPAGSRAIKETSEENETFVVQGFQGSFDGDGHTISNVTIDYDLRATEYLGLFGALYQADVKNLKVESTVTITSASAEGGACVGAVAGIAQYSTLNNIQAKLTVKTSLTPDNSLSVGGVVGMYLTATQSDHIEIYDCSNLYAEIDLEAVPFDKGNAESVLDSAFAGGIFGYANMSMGGGLALYNVSAKGTIGGGKYLGGIIGYIAGDYVSIINAVSDVDLTLSAKDGSSESSSPFAGGIVGESLYDAVIMDCYASGDIHGTNGSYIGGIVGSSIGDLFDENIERGTVVVNCYYSGNISGSANICPEGTKTQNAFTQEFAVNTLKFDTQTWTITDGNTIPDGKNAGEINNGQYTVTLNVSESTSTVTRGGNGYELMGSIDTPKVPSGSNFWDWQFAEGVDYRMYVPVIKNMSLTAKITDVSDYLCIYEGTSDYAGNQVGVIQLNGDGTLNYVLSITGTTTKGTWRFDGEHFYAELEDGDVKCGTLGIVGGKRTIEWTQTEGTGRTIVYTFVEIDGDMQLVGEYYSADGDIITFSGSNSVTLSIDDIIGHGVNNAISATYTQAGSVLTISGLDTYYSIATITITDNGFTTNFVALAGTSYTNIQKDFVSVDDLNINYSEFGLLGEANSLYMYNEYQEERAFNFKDDGTLTYGSTDGRYYIFGSKVKIIADGYLSTFNYDSNGNYLYGYMERGYTARSQTVITSIADGDLNGYIIGVDRNNVVFVTNKTQYYLVGGRLFDVIISGTFADGEVVTIDGTRYLVEEGMYGIRHANALREIGDEEGTYSLDGKAFRLNGVDKVTGEAFTGMYSRSGNIIALYNAKESRLVVFDYTAAQTQGYVVTPVMGDGYQGIWYNDNADGERHYAIILDGFGHTQCLYLTDEDYYKPTWEDNWATYTVNADGTIKAVYNDSQDPTFTFYYNKQIMQIAGSYMLNDRIFYQDGFEGEKAVPTFDAKLAGKYSGNGVELEVKANGTGTFNGTAFTARVDAKNVLIFTVNGTVYTFDGNALTLTYGTTVVSLTAGESEQLDISGIWTGTLISDHPMYLKGSHSATFTFQNGTLTIEVGSMDAITAPYVWNAADMTLTATLSKAYWSDISVSDVTFTVTDVIAVVLTCDFDGSDFTLKGELTKQTADENLPFPQGTWRGTVTQGSGINDQSGKTVIVEFTADGKITVTIADTIVYTGTYTYQDNVITAQISGSYDVEKFELSVEGTTISMMLQLYDTDSMNRFVYTATLSK